MPQPNFDPVSPKMSRRYQSSGISGSPLKDCSAPFTVSWIIFIPHNEGLPGMSFVEFRSTFLWNQRPLESACCLPNPDELAAPFAESPPRNPVLVLAPTALR